MTHVRLNVYFSCKRISFYTIFRNHSQKINQIEHCFYRVMYIGQSTAENDVLLTGYRQDLPCSGKLPVLRRSRKSAFLPRRGDLLNRFVSNSAGSTWVRLPMRNFTLIGARAWVRGPKSRKFPLLVKNRASRPIWKSVRGFYAPTYPSLVFYI